MSIIISSLFDYDLYPGYTYLFLEDRQAERRAQEGRADIQAIRTVNKKLKSPEQPINPFHRHHNSLSPFRLFL